MPALGARCAKPSTVDPPANGVGTDAQKGCCLTYPILAHARILAKIQGMLTTFAVGNLSKVPYRTGLRTLPPVDHPEDVFEAASAELAERHPQIGRLYEQIGPCVLRAPQSDDFTALARAIVFQQLTGKAALTIWGRVVAALDGSTSPPRVATASQEELRAAGLSRNKAASIKDLAAKAVDGSVPLMHMQDLSDEEIIERLSTVRGIGVWTAEMFLIFQLRRLDVWPVGDLGVRKGYARAFAFEAPPTPKELDPLGEVFRPFRTVAAWYCWRAVETITPEGTS
jgi:DNA-3-methyladenine glycosylase II